MDFTCWVLVTLSIISLYSVKAQLNGECHFPRLTPRHGLNLSKLMGKWYLHEFASSDRGFDSTNPNFKCNSLNYVPEEGLTSNGKFTSMESHLNMTTGRIEHFKVPIRVPKLNSPLSSIWDAKTLNGDTKMLVLAVDREHANWYLLYSCSIIGTRKYRWETVGIWSRFKSIEPSLRNILKDYLIGLGLPIQSHKFHSQENC